MEEGKKVYQKEIRIFVKEGIEGHKRNYAGLTVEVMIE